MVFFISMTEHSKHSSLLVCYESFIWYDRVLLKKRISAWTDSLSSVLLELIISLLYISARFLSRLLVMVRAVHWVSVMALSRQLNGTCEMNISRWRLFEELFSVDVLPASDTANGCLASCNVRRARGGLSSVKLSVIPWFGGEIIWGVLKGVVGGIFTNTVKNNWFYSWR